MSKYLGIHTQQRSNDRKTIILLLLFPTILIALTWLSIYLIFLLGVDQNQLGEYTVVSITNSYFIDCIPFVVGGCAIWFLIAYFFNVKMIQAATGAKPLDRKENKRVYNLIENLCIEINMPMPKINILEDDSLNAFASGINSKTYTVTLSRGIINRLNDDELEGVIAHELTHIKNKDVRLLIVSIVFVGIFSFIVQIASRMFLHSSYRGGRRSSGNNKSKGGEAIIMIVVLVMSVIAYFIGTLIRFAISRKREYMADAGAAEMTRKPWALASALRKISDDPRIEAVEQKDVAQLFIENPLKNKISGMFATHPPISKRIEILEQF